MDTDNTTVLTASNCLFVTLTFHGSVNITMHTGYWTVQWLASEEHPRTILSD